MITYIEDFENIKRREGLIPAAKFLRHMGFSATEIQRVVKFANLREAARAYEATLADNQKAHWQNLYTALEAVLGDE